MSNAIHSAEHFIQEDIGHLYYNQVLMLDENRANWLRQVAGTGLRRQALQAADGQMAAWDASYTRDGQKPYQVSNGIAIISVRGMLEHASMWYSEYWTGYEAIRYLFDAAMADYEVKGIAFHIRSPGGMVAGNFDLNDHLYKSRGKKPMWAIVNEHSYSAAYSIASCADRIVVARTGGVGSIGACAVMYNYADMLKQAGIAAKVIRSGARKMKPNGIEHWEDEDLARIQDDIDKTGELFIATVARNRNLDPDVIRSTQAATFRADEGVALGLADAIMSVDDAMAALQKELSGSSITGGITTMSTENQQQAGDTVTKAQHDAAVAQARTDGMKAGAEAENARIMGILTLEESKGREQAAMALAKNPGMTADHAKEFLAAVPVAAIVTEDPLSAAMRATGTPGISSEEGDDTQQQIDTWATYDQLHGIKKRQA